MYNNIQLYNSINYQKTAQEQTIIEIIICISFFHSCLYQTYEKVNICQYISYE